MPAYKKVLGALLLLFFLAAAALLVPHSLIKVISSRHLHDDVNTVDTKSAALVLGCSKMIGPGRPNLFFRSRIQAAADLFHAGKVKVIVVSGDNSTKEYDEPTDMKEALVAAGVPESRIFCDYAGFRTLDSVVRMEKIFGQRDFIIVSQRFHNERAVYIARRKGLNAEALNAEGVSIRSAPTTYLREALARLVAVLDVELFNTAPKFLGPPVEVLAANQP
jgi:SanA protein